MAQPEPGQGDSASHRKHPGRSALAVGSIEDETLSIGIYLSRAKKGILRAKLAVLITKDFCRAGPTSCRHAPSVATGISASTRSHPGEVCLPWCPFFVTCRSVRHEIELSEGGSLFF